MIKLQYLYVVLTTIDTNVFAEVPANEQLILSGYPIPTRPYSIKVLTRIVFVGLALACVVAFLAFPLADSSVLEPPVEFFFW